MQLTPHPPGAHMHATAARARPDTVADRVLDEGLENEMGDAPVERLRGYVHPHLEPIPEPDLLDLQVARDELALLLERHLPGRGALEHAAQQTPEPCPYDHARAGL